MAFHSDFNTSPSRSLISGSLGNHPEDCVRMSVGVVLIRHKDSVCVRARMHMHSAASDSATPWTIARQAPL